MTNKYSNKKREDLLAWFHKEAEPLAQTYEAALRLLEDKNFPDRVHLISHATREICNRLPEILDPQIDNQRMDYVKHLDKIEKIWPPLETDKLGNDVSPTAQQTINLDLKIALEINHLVQAHKQSIKSAVKFESLFRFLMRNHPATADNNLRVAQDFKKIAREFQSTTHVSNEKVELPVEEELQKRFARFEDMLYSFVGNFFTGREKLDELLIGIKPEQVDEVVALLASPHHEDYFFKNLQESSLILPLKKKGLFKAPPRKEPLKEGGIRHPRWEASSFLSRMAHKAPDVVITIFNEIETENPSIIRDIVQGSLAVPGRTSSKIIPKICKAARNGLLQLCFKEVSDLCVKLAEEGELSTSESLAKSIFKPNWNKITNQLNHWDEYQYQENLRKVIPVLAKTKISNSFLVSLCYWLKHFIETREHFNMDSGSDHSYIWRPAIEEHVENHNYDFSGVMVGLVREGFEQAIECGSIALQESIQILNQHKYLIFKRIKLHLLNRFGGRNPLLASQAIMDQNLFEDIGCKREYAMLVANRLSLLTNEERKEWFSWIDKGPRLDECEKSPYNEEQKQNYIKHWKYQRLHWVRTQLNEKNKKTYEKMHIEFGTPSMADLNVSFSGGVRGYETPITLEDMQKLNFIDVINTVSNWITNRSAIEGPSVSGLAKTFSEYVSTNSIVFSRKAKLLIGKPAIYIREYIEQMTHSILLGQDIEVEAVLDLCAWVIGQPADIRTTPFQEHEGLIDLNWQWTRDSISQFLKKMCEAKIGELPQYRPNKFKKIIWSLIVNLIKDDARTHLLPKINKETPYSKDYLENGINSSEGKAIEAGFAYARWIANENKLFSRPHDNTSKDFEEMPEVKAMIENVLSSGKRPAGSLAIIGFNINLIYWIGLDWLKINAKRLFPLPETEESESSAWNWAAWNTFLIWVKPHFQYFQLFKEQYSLTSGYYAGKIVLANRDSNPIFHFGEHLVTLYLRGNLRLEGILSDFLTTVEARARIHTIKYVGKLLGQHQTVSYENIYNSQQLWENYWPTNGVEDVKKYPTSWPFESWFLCEKFPIEWSLNQVESCLKENPLAEFDDRILKELAKFVDVDVKKIFMILDMTVRKSQPWQIAGFIESAMIIVESALKADEQTHIKAKSLIDYLGRLGYLDFGKLLRS